MKDNDTLDVIVDGMVGIDRSPYVLLTLDKTSVLLTPDAVKALVMALKGYSGEAVKMAGQLAKVENDSER